MLLTVLGCSGSVPGPDSPASGYLVRAGNTTVALDLGNGTFGALQRHIDPLDLDAVILSHLHPDHCADVSALAVYRRYLPRAASEPGPALALYGPSTSADRLTAAYATSAEERAVTDLSDTYDFREFHPGEDGGHWVGPIPVGQFELSAARVAHSCEAYALRLCQNGRTLVYSGDTGPCPELVEVAAGADVLLAEASWQDRPDNPRSVHLSGRDAGRAAAAAAVGRLLITHVPPWTDSDAMVAEARSVFAGPVELVRAGADYSV